MTLRTLNYGNYGIFLIMGNAGFCPSAVSPVQEEDSLLNCSMIQPTPPKVHVLSTKKLWTTLNPKPPEALNPKQGFASRVRWMLRDFSSEDRLAQVRSGCYRQISRNRQ